MSVAKQIRKHLFQLYGNLISIEEPTFDSERRLWTAQLKADYPRIIRDDSTDETYLRFLSMERLGRIDLTEDFRLKKATPREECVEKIRLFLVIWQERAERIITYASADKLAKLNEARYEFSPIMQIVSNFLQTGFMSQDEIEGAPRGWRWNQYLKLLEGLDLATKTEQGYAYGNLFAELSHELEGDSKKLRTAILSHVIRERYPTLRDVFKTRQFEPYVHINSCYYKPALEAEKLIYRSPETIIATYVTVYRRSPTIKLRHHIQSLIEVGALHRKRNYLYGDEELFSTMLEMKAELPKLTSPAAGRISQSRLKNRDLLIETDISEVRLG